MPKRAILLLVVAGLLIGIGVLAVGFYIGNYFEGELIALSGSGPPAAQEPVISAGQVRGVSSGLVQQNGEAAGTPSPESSPSLMSPRLYVPILPSSSPVSEGVAPADATNSPIVFVHVPETVRRGESFTVSWRVEGPVGVAGEEAQMVVSSHSLSAAEGSSTASSSRSQQGFGSFVIPATFSGNFRFDTQDDSIAVEVMAKVQGATLYEARTVQLTD